MNNVNTIRHVYDAFASADLEAVLGAFDPEIEWLTPSTLPWSRGDYHGIDQVADYFQSFSSHLTNAAIIPSEFLAADEHVVVHGQEQGTSTRTGHSFSAAFTHTWTIRHNKINRMRGVVDTAAVNAAFQQTPTPGS